MTWGPRLTLAALAATVLLAGSSCDNDAQFDPPPAQSSYLTKADDLHHAILVQGDSRPAPDWVRKRWEPVDSVRKLDKHAFEDRRLPPCTDGRPAGR